MELDDSSHGSLDDTSDLLGLPSRSERDSEDAYLFRRAQYTKLEVISAQQITVILRTVLLCVALSVAATVFSCLVVQLMYTRVQQVPVQKGILSDGAIENATNSKQLGSSLRQATESDKLTFIEMRVELLPKDSWYNWIMNVVNIAGAILLFVVGIGFLVRIANAGRENLTHEQMFTCALIFVSLLYFNIPLTLFQINVSLNQVIEFPLWFMGLENPFRMLKDGIFGPFLAFYVLCNIHTYRILDPQEKIGLKFFAPKVALVLGYSLLRTVSYITAGVETSDMPFVTAVFTFWTFGRSYFSRAYPVVFTLVLLITIYELVIVSIAIWQGYVTMLTLRRAPYMIHRTKHVGFRFFTYLTTVFFVTYFITSATLSFGRPLGNYFIAITLDFFMMFVPWNHAIGPSIIVLCYVLVSAYVNLPHDSIGVFKGWFAPSELAPSISTWDRSWSGSNNSFSESTSFASSAKNSRYGSITNSAHSRYGNATNNSSNTQSPYGSVTEYSSSGTWFQVDNDHELDQQIVEPIIYRKCEADNTLELQANCFTMQTHVFLFNFAWYVYYFDTPKFERLKNSKGILPFEFKVSECIVEKSTDTQVLVIDGSDRILVSFKGSTSLRNLRTSFSGHQRRLSRVVPTDIDGKDESKRLRAIFGGTYEAAAIHAGFATAYSSVGARVLHAIRRLRQTCARPVFLTGHSLGGALATVCALDVWIKLRVSRRHILVSTFGAPRVGNIPFARVYDSAIALHWRVVLGPDLVTNLPKIGYKHVGKKALLTPHGDLFIDPSALERKLWSGTTAGLGYHRKASYLLAMRSWCVRHHPKMYTPLFFDFPVSQQDMLRFEGAQVASKGSDAFIPDNEDTNEDEFEYATENEDMIEPVLSKEDELKLAVKNFDAFKSEDERNKEVSRAVKNWEQLTMKLCKIQP